ncbi:MAG: DUF433 domain-containing protein [Chloroflexi bacterium]|nr:DUF433 domain-containing protein [Chloroflexota bacterium]
MVVVTRAKASIPARIVRNPGVCGGEPTVEGTRIPVRSIVIQWQYYQDLERVRSAFPRLNIPTIKAALTFYEANREEIDRLIEENEQAAYSAD